MLVAVFMLPSTMIVQGLHRYRSEAPEPFWAPQRKLRFRPAEASFT